MTDTWPPPPKITLKPGAMEELQRRRIEAASQPGPQCGYGRNRAAAARVAALPPPGFADVPVMIGTSVQIAVLCLPLASTMERDAVDLVRRKVLAAFDAYYAEKKEA